MARPSLAVILALTAATPAVAQTGASDAASKAPIASMPTSHAAEMHDMPAHPGMGAAPPAVAGQPAGVPVQPGQAAFGAAQEIVRMLLADPGTDWSKVNVDALRQHLIDMNEVVMRAKV